MGVESELALIVLYRDLIPGELDLTQLGDEEQVDKWLNAETAGVLNDLKAALDLDNRGDRYVAALAYVLSIRRQELALPDIETQIAALGEAILDRYNASSSGEMDLRGAMERLLVVPVIDQDIVDLLLTAFGGALSAVPNADGSFDFLGDAAEMATMLSALASMEMACQAQTGTVTTSDGVRHEVLSLRFEVCNPLPFERSAKAVDPRNWPTFSPLFFDSVMVVGGTPTSTGAWHGTIQEKVGALLTGTPIVTNLLVSYHEAPGLAVTVYDLSQDATLLPDDGTVKVDYGYFAVTDEGLHRRVSVLKVVSIEGKENTSPDFLCPLWAQQLGMIGFWF